MYILRYSKASPHVRKILLAAHHLGLRDNITLEVADTSRDLSVDARLHEEPRRRRQDTIELDLNDASVLVVQDSAPSLPETPDGDEANVQGAAVADTLEQKLPAFNAGVPVPPGSQATSEDQSNGSPETEQFQMVSDQAVFDASSLPSKPGTRDEYDTLEADFDEQDMGSRGAPYVSSETQAFQRADMVGSHPTTEQRGATGSMAVLLILLAVGLVAYVMLRDKPTTNTLAKQNAKNATSKTVTKVMRSPGTPSTAGAPGQRTGLSSADVVQPQSDHGAVDGDSESP